MRRLQIIVFLILGLCLPITVSGDTTSDINAALDYYEEVWSEGNLDAVRGYYHPDFVLLANGEKFSLAERMKDLEAVMKPGEDHGELDYTNVTVEALGEEHALAYGQVRLGFRDGTRLETWFSTVYVNTPFGWKALMTHN